MSLLSAKWVLLWSLWAMRLVPLYTPVVRVSNGLVRGVLSTDGSYSAYFSIPYGSTSRETRFQAPGPEPKWKDVFNAVDESVRCPQRFHNNIMMGQENCLTLNVYTPKTEDKSKLPVMVFIHGGGFFEGSGSRMLYGPEYLISKGIILVTINYRFNIQGFLCLGIKEAPGNAGMKDQVAALRWVQRNIAAFGGDPDNVTIFGESAGSASVSYHMISPMSKGLFNKAIMQSGSTLGAWAFQYDPVYLASLLAKSMLQDTQDPRKLYNIFMNKTDEELIVTRVPRKKGNIMLTELLYTPCVERVIEGVEPFLTELPIKLLTSGNINKVPVIIGSNIEEGLLFASVENKTSVDQMSMDKMIPKNLRFPSPGERAEVVKKLTEFYVGDDEISMESIPKLSRFYGEPYFNVPVLIEAELYLESSLPVYSYLLKYEGKRNVPKWMTGGMRKKLKGAVHADDLFYIFNQWLIPIEDPMTEVVTTMWTNFAKFSNPTPKVTPLTPVKWEPLKLGDMRSLAIDKELSYEPLFFNERLLYFKTLYEKYRRMDYEWT